MANQRIEVQTGPGLTEVVSALTPLNRIDLVNYDELSAAVHSLDTGVSMVPSDVGGDLTIESLLTGCPGFGQELGHDFATNLNARIQGFDVWFLKPGIYYYSAGAEAEGENIAVAGLISPVDYNGLTIRTTGEGFLWLPDEARIRQVQRTIGIHVLALNTLVEALHDYPDEGPLLGDGGKPRVVFLTAKQEAIDVEPEAQQIITNPHEHFASFVGMDNVVEELCDMVTLANTPEETRKKYDVELIQSVLLNGPTGVGKTELARSLAKALDANLVEVDFNDVANNPYVGQWAMKVGQIFKDAYAREGRTLIFLDEMDGLVAAGNEGTNGNITAVLKKQLEELRKHPHVFFVGATNNPDAIDPVVRADKRMQRKISIPHPDDSGRERLLDELIIGNWERDVVGDDRGCDEDRMQALESLFELRAAIKELSEQTKDFSPGDIKELVAGVKRVEFLRAMREGRELSVPTAQDYRDAISRARKNRA
ncbi:ATP-binding protein [Patescibacteria group bacterium]|nr:MAG: ATP-binding protein [Patescibacteria group bacterium]